MRRSGLLEKAEGPESYSGVRTTPRESQDGSVASAFGTRTCRSVLLDAVFLVRWFDVPSPEVLEDLLGELHAAHHRLGQSLAYVSVAGAHVGVPSGMQQAALTRFGQRASAWVDECHLVFEGEGFKHALQRSVITALYFLKKPSAVPVHVHRTLQDAVHDLSPKHVLRAQFLQRVEGEGLFDPRPA
jgi:hypothetical protein